MIRIIITLAVTVLLVTAASVFAIKTQAPSKPLEQPILPKVDETPPKAEKAVTKPENASDAKKKVVDPQGCEPEQYWDKNPPHNCIDKPVVASASARPAEVTSSPVGDKYTWMRLAGIPEAEWSTVDAIVTRESGWNPNAVNPSSGACGLGQQLPCGKWAGQWNDPVDALVAMKGYVAERYGGWSGAWAFWQANSWY